MENDQDRRKKRSSILKPTRPLTPEDKSFLSPNTDTMTFKPRRVSFASSNFVKPFAADPEKNTIWDNTYEEYVDQTDSLKSVNSQESKLSDTNLPDIQVPVIDKENIFPAELIKPLLHPNEDINLSNTKHVSIIEYVKSNKTIVFEQGNTMELSQFMSSINESMQTQPVMESTSSTGSIISAVRKKRLLGTSQGFENGHQIQSSSSENSVYINQNVDASQLGIKSDPNQSVSYNYTKLNQTDMEMTNVNLKNSSKYQSVKFPSSLSNSQGVDLDTDCQPTSLIKLYKSRLNTEKEKTDRNFTELPNTSQKQLITTAGSEDMDLSTIKPSLSGPKETQVMEFTRLFGALENENFYKENTHHTISNQSTTMDFTCAVAGVDLSKKTNRSQLNQPETMDFTRTIGLFEKKDMKKVDLNYFESNQTQPMELTTAVESLQNPNLSTNKANRSDFNQTQSMDFTKVISSSKNQDVEKGNYHCNNSNKSQVKEFTCVVASSEDSVLLTNKANHSGSNMAQTMEFTRLISSSEKENIVNVNINCSKSNKSQPMEFTRGIASFEDPDLSANKTNRSELHQAQTMEFTRVTGSAEEENRKFSCSKSDKSNPMEFTRGIASFEDPNLSANKTNRFELHQAQSMEFTRVTASTEEENRKIIISCSKSNKSQPMEFTRGIAIFEDLDLSANKANRSELHQAQSKAFTRVTGSTEEENKKIGISCSKSNKSQPLDFTRGIAIFEDLDLSANKANRSELHQAQSMAFTRVTGSTEEENKKNSISCSKSNRTQPMKFTRGIASFEDPELSANKTNRSELQQAQTMEFTRVTGSSEEEYRKFSCSKSNNSQPMEFTRGIASIEDPDLSANKTNLSELQQAQTMEFTRVTGSSEDENRKFSCSKSNKSLPMDFTHGVARLEDPELSANKANRSELHQPQTMEFTRVIGSLEKETIENGNVNYSRSDKAQTIEFTCAVANFEDSELSSNKANCSEVNQAQTMEFTKVIGSLVEENENCNLDCSGSYKGRQTMEFTCAVANLDDSELSSSKANCSEVNQAQTMEFTKVIGSLEEENIENCHLNCNGSDKKRQTMEFTCAVANSEDSELTSNKANTSELNQAQTMDFTRLIGSSKRENIEKTNINCSRWDQSRPMECTLAAASFEDPDLSKLNQAQTMEFTRVIGSSEKENIENGNVDCSSSDKGQTMEFTCAVANLEDSDLSSNKANRSELNQAQTMEFTRVISSSEDEHIKEPDLANKENCSEFNQAQTMDFTRISGSLEKANVKCSGSDMGQTMEFTRAIASLEDPDLSINKANHSDLNQAQTVEFTRVIDSSIMKNIENGNVHCNRSNKSQRMELTRAAAGGLEDPNLSINIANSSELDRVETMDMRRVIATLKRKNIENVNQSQTMEFTRAMFSLENPKVSPNKSNIAEINQAQTIESISDIGAKKHVKSCDDKGECSGFENTQINQTMTIDLPRDLPNSKHLEITRNRTNMFKMNETKIKFTERLSNTRPKVRELRLSSTRECNVTNISHSMNFTEVFPSESILQPDKQAGDCEIPKNIKITKGNSSNLKNVIYSERIFHDSTQTMETPFASMNFSSCNEDTQQLINAHFSQPETFQSLHLEQVNPRAVEDVVVIDDSLQTLDGQDENLQLIEKPVESDDSLQILESPNNRTADDPMEVDDSVELLDGPENSLQKKNKSYQKIDGPIHSRRKEWTLIHDDSDIEDSLQILDDIDGNKCESDIKRPVLQLTTKEYQSENSYFESDVLDSNVSHNYTRQCESIFNDIRKYLDPEDEPIHKSKQRIRKRWDDFYIIKKEYEYNQSKIEDVIGSFQLPKLEIVDIEQYLNERNDLSENLQDIDATRPENDETRNEPKSWLELLQEAEERDKRYWQLIEVTGDIYHFKTLFRSISMKVNLNPESGTVTKLKISKNIRDNAPPLMFYTAELFQQRLNKEHLESVLGQKYDILSLMSYVCIVLVKISNYMADFLSFEKRYRFTHKVRMTSDFCIIFEILNVDLIIWWILTLRLSTTNMFEIEDVTVEHKPQVSVDVKHVKKIVQSVPHEGNYIITIIEKLEEYAKRMGRQHTYMKKQPS